MQRRETYVAPEQPPAAPRRSRRLAAGAIVAAGALTVAGVGAAASASAGWWPRHHRGPHATGGWTLPPVTRDAFAASRPSPLRTTAMQQTPAPLLARRSASALAVPTHSDSPTPTATATSTPSAGTAASATAAPITASGVYGTADHLFAADSPWNTPIATDAALDPESGAIVSAVLNNRSLVVNLDLASYGQPFYTATASTPRITLAGGSRIGAVPMDPAWAANAGADAKLNIIDPTTSTIYEIDGYNAATHSAIWAVKHDYATALGDGYPGNGELRGPTGSGMSQAAGTIRVSDIQSGSIDHALSFITSSPVAGFRYPASQTDGRGSGVGVQEGMRVQLDPSVDVDAIPGLSAGERMIARALQTYGAFCSDNGGGSNQAMGIYMQKATTSAEQAVYTNAGITTDWQVLSKIPRADLRVLAASATPNPNG